ncbi:MAG: potassium/proton antiporter, partial [Thermoanaerobaculia bacterium]
MPLEEILAAIAVLLILSIFASKASGRLGVPALILFLGLGMLAGSEGLGGIYFDNVHVAERLGVIALAFLLFAGGLETDWKFVRHSVWRGISISTIGVAITTVVVGLFAHFVAGFTLLEGMLLGAIVSPTDAAAVFSILRASGVRLRHEVSALLELESGSNDPMAVFLTTAFIQLIMQPKTSALGLVIDFVQEMTFGAIAGVLIGLAAVRLLNRLRLDVQGLYPVLTIAVVLFTYGATAMIGGNGFLAVYITGIVMGSHNFVQRRTLMRFHDGVAWLMQIAMFVTLGLLVFPSQLVPVAGVSVLVAVVLIFVARPVAVFVSLAASKMNVREKALVSRVGLRGAVPIILATFPLLAAAPKAPTIFNIVFFIVIASVALQGTTIPLVARLLKVEAPAETEWSPSVAHLSGRGDSSIVTVEVKERAPAAGHRIVDLERWPREALILVLYRGAEFFVPNGGTPLQRDDRLIVLTSKSTVDTVRGLIEGV